MKSAIRGYAAAVVGLLVCLPTLDASASADDTLNPPREDWRTAFDFGIEFDLEERTSMARGTIETRESKDEFVSTVFRLGLQGEGPPIEALPFGLRPVVRGGLRWTRSSASSDDGNYELGDPNDLLASILAPSISSQLPVLQNATRLGRELRMAAFDPAGNEGFEVAYRNTDVPGFYAGFALAYDIAIPGDDMPGWFSIKPGLDWSMRHYTLRGGLTQVDLTGSAPPVLPRPQGEAPLSPGTMFPSVYEVTRQIDTHSYWEHRIGPSIELEAGLRDQESFAVSLYFAARFQLLVSRAIHTWGNPHSITRTEYDRMPDVAGPAPLSSAGQNIRFRSEAELLMLTLGGGLRFYWF